MRTGKTLTTLIALTLAVTAPGVLAADDTEMNAMLVTGAGSSTDLRMTEPLSSNGSHVSVRAGNAVDPEGSDAMGPSSYSEEFRDAFTAVTPSNFDSGGAISRQFHLHAESYLRMATVARREDAAKLEVASSRALARQPVRHNGLKKAFADYVAGDPLLDGVVILHHGKVVFEAYPNMRPWQRHFAWSVTKVVTATMLAALAEAGRVDMDAPVGRYVAALAETAWARISIQDIANMTSGIDCRDSDGYQDPTTCVYTMEEALGITAATGRAPDLIEHLQAMRVLDKAGTKHEYVSANTNVLMLVIEAVTDKPFALVLEELVWNPIGAEADALIAISAAGYAYASGGLHARLRDVARFGQVYTQPELSGVLSRSRIGAIQSSGIALSSESLEALQEDFGDDLPVRAAWQWDMIWPDGALYKAGYSGQGLYADPARSLVIAWFGTGVDYEASNNAMLSIGRQIARSGLFDAPARTSARWR